MTTYTFQADHPVMVFANEFGTKDSALTALATGEWVDHEDLYVEAEKVFKANPGETLVQGSAMAVMAYAQFLEAMDTAETMAEEADEEENA